MKKVLSLVLALVLVLGMIPTFAAAHETGAELLFEHNFIVGDENGDLMVEKMLTRDEMTVLLAQMYGKEVEAAAFVAPANFTDAAEFGWAANFISFAQASEWLSGFPDGTYRAKEAVTGEQLLSFLMQVLGYDFEWNTVVADAAAVGLTVSTEGPILRGAAFETMWIAV
ncbi:MAG: S-layer homology domain-containing protein, partial [Clostridia bacterium]|nr:S-layer homology domain-containing protein [Clostridia bacterium]